MVGPLETEELNPPMVIDPSTGTTLGGEFAWSSMPNSSRPFILASGSGSGEHFAVNAFRKVSFRSSTSYFEDWQFTCGIVCP